MCNGAGTKIDWHFTVMSMLFIHFLHLWIHDEETRPPSSYKSWTNTVCETCRSWSNIQRGDNATEAPPTKGREWHAKEEVALGVCSYPNGLFYSWSSSRGMDINNPSKHFQFVIERVTSGWKVAGSMDDLQEQAVEKQSRFSWWERSLRTCSSSFRKGRTQRGWWEM